MNNKYEILTPEGFKDFDSVSVKKANDLYKITDEHNNCISATAEHLFLSADEQWIAVKDMSVGTELCNGKIVSIEQIPGEHDVYDIMNIDDVHCFNASGFVAHNSFLGSSNTLIALDTIKKIERTIERPISFSKTTKIYVEPEKLHRYICTCDCADVGVDFSTVNVLDITTYPFKQVAVYKDDKISGLLFPQVIYQLATKYNLADVLIESNDVGKMILHILNYDIDYPNVISTRIGNKTSLGQRTTSKSKPIGCLRLKDLLESGKLLIRDADTLDEIRHFVLNNAETSYAAEDGYHDDIIMGLVIFAYYASTPSFSVHFDDENFTDEYRRQYEEELVETLLPSPVFGKNFADDEDDDDYNEWLQG